MGKKQNKKRLKKYMKSRKKHAEKQNEQRVAAAFRNIFVKAGILEKKEGSL